MSREIPLTRRRLLGTLGAAGVAAGSTRAALLGTSPPVYDVIVVGGGGAGLSAAIGVKREDPGASVLLLEAKPLPGGTSFRSGGRLWIPNNADLRAAGLADPRDMALRYMARLSYPDRYDAAAPLLGLTPRAHAQLGAYYDNGAELLDWLRATGVMPWEAERGSLLPASADPLALTGQLAPDYHPELAEDIPKVGRSILPKMFDPTLLTTQGAELHLPDYGAFTYGIELIAWLRYACLVRGVEVRADHRVIDIVVEPGAGGPAVRGVVAQLDAADIPLPARVEFRARRGVIFASGGFSKNLDRLNQHFTGDHAFTGGGCAVTSAQGDLIDIAERHGLLLERLDRAWFIQNVYEQYKLDPDSRLTPNYLIFQAYWPNGDSMFMVNRHGLRVVNEKINYHTRSQAHFQPDNRFLISVFDQHAIDYFIGVGGHITPLLQTFIGPCPDTAALAGRVHERMQRYPETRAFGLADDFHSGLETTLARFNGFAERGIDQDFQRGETSIEVWWHAFCLTFHGYDLGPVHDCITANTNPDGVRYPNVTMRPLKPPYYAIIMSSGLQDTNGGPAIDEHARILKLDGTPMPGLYGAGNCIASPAGQGYWGAGGTLGPAVVFGHIAGRHAAGRR